MRMIAVWITLASLLLWSCSGFRATAETLEPTAERATPSPETMDPAALEQAKQDIYRVVASQACDDGVVYNYPEVEYYPLYGSEIEYAAAQLPASSETWANYRLVNDPDQPIATFSDFPINCQYEFVSPTDVVCAGPVTDCIVPYGFSAIGFNKTGTQALIYMYRDCSECGGGGDIYLLVKREQAWVIINYLALWVS